MADADGCLIARSESTVPEPQGRSLIERTMLSSGGERGETGTRYGEQTQLYQVDTQRRRGWEHV